MNTPTVYRYSALALALDVAMHDNPTAQAAYLATWGVPWVPLAERYGDDGFGVVGQEVEAAFSRIQDPCQSEARMAEAGVTGVL